MKINRLKLNFFVTVFLILEISSIFCHSYKLPESSSKSTTLKENLVGAETIKGKFLQYIFL